MAVRTLVSHDCNANMNMVIISCSSETVVFAAKKVFCRLRPSMILHSCGTVVLHRVCLFSRSKWEFFLRWWFIYSEFWFWRLWSLLKFFTNAINLPRWSWKVNASFGCTAHLNSCFIPCVSSISLENSAWVCCFRYPFWLLSSWGNLSAF